MLVYIGCYIRSLRDNPLKWVWEQLIFTTIRECHTGEKALGFKVNGSKAWSVGIKRNKDYIYRGKNRFAPCRGPNNSKFPRVQSISSSRGGEISHRIFVMMQQHKLCLKDANSNFKFEFSIVFPMSKTTTICGTCEHYGVVEPALSMTPSWALVFSERQLKFGVKHNKQESNNVSLSFTRLRQALWNSSRNSKSLAQLKRTFWRMSEAHCYRLAYHWNPPAKHSTQWWS